MKRTLAAVLFSASVFAQGIPGVINSGVEPKLIKEGFTFTEGPLGSKDGGLYFSEINDSNKTYFRDASGKMTVVRENTNGGNGLAFLKDGSIVYAEGDSKRISKRVPAGTVTTLTEGLPEKPLLSPNDVIANRKGGIYFTDPGPRPIVAGRKAYVYYLPPGAKDALMVDDSITRPNGLTLTKNEKTLIVDDTVGDTVFAFDVQSDGTLKNKRAFAQMQNTPAGKESGADGLALDNEDRVYITSATGVQVFDRTGMYLGTIKFPRQPANLAFSGPGKKTLYVTARQGLYSVEMLSRGPNRLGK